MRWYQSDIRGLTESEYTRYYALLPEEKRRRVDRFRFPDDKKRAVAGERLARRAIAEWCGISEERVVLASDSNGKPFARGLNVGFSVGHSGNLAVCAVDAGPVGIDVERIRPISPSIVRRVCTAEELRYIFDRQPAEAGDSGPEGTDTLSRFFALWTQKEAYGKFTGLGVFRTNFLLPESGVFQTFRQGGYMISIYSPCCAD